MRNYASFDRGRKIISTTPGFQTNMHNKAEEKVKRVISGALKHCIIKDSWPEYESYETHVESFAKEFLKTKSQWIGIVDVFSIFIDHVYKSLPPFESLEEEHNASLNEILTDKELNILCERIFNYINGIPRAYSIYFPLPPIVELTESVIIGESMRIERVISRKDYPGKAYPRGLLGSNQDLIDPPEYYLVFEVQGYCNSNLRSSGTSRAMSSYKIAMQQILARGFLKEDKNVPNGLEIFAWMDSHNVRKHYLVAKDNNLPDEPSTEVPLSIDLCRFIESFKFFNSHKLIKSAIEKNELPKLIREYFDSAAKLHATDNKDALRVKIAVEWAFDADLSNNLTMSFIQTCIALEALYGDDNSSDNLTQTLADRCAYSLGANIEERRDIKTKFRELYKIRSKIVHGNVGALATEEERLLAWGKLILKFSIFKEIKQLSLDRLNPLEFIS